MSNDEFNPRDDVLASTSAENSDVEDYDDGFQSGSDAVDVDLSQSYLETLPPDYFFGKEARYRNHSRIRCLNLSQNRILHFPNLIWKFRNLISLDLSNNNLVSIPEEIFYLQRLKSFSARNNVLENVPKSMLTLNKLEVLNLSGNYFEAIPPIVFEMKNLKALYFGANRIDVLPPAIGALTDLEILYLGGNRLTEVPASLGRLSQLTSLVLADNQLETIPPTFADLQSLRSLTLHNNHIKALPTGIARLQNLGHLSLRNNPLVTKFVNDILFAPPSLKELAARVVKIRSSPNMYDNVLPQQLLDYLNSANQCVNPKCKGVYFESCAELVKFVDFCGKYRVPLLQYLCSPRCSSTPSTSQAQAKMKKVLLG
ncbi:leucine rich repeat domain-containing protein [Ditylenchus destructor]|nr:leucine rich repeat domain-containing protein [Ditylenchus destructor]